MLIIRVCINDRIVSLTDEKYVGLEGVWSAFREIVTEIMRDETCSMLLMTGFIERAGDGWGAGRRHDKFELRVERRSADA